MRNKHAMNATTPSLGLYRLRLRAVEEPARFHRAGRLSSIGIGGSVHRDMPAKTGNPKSAAGRTNRRHAPERDPREGAGCVNANVQISPTPRESAGMKLAHWV